MCEQPITCTFTRGLGLESHDTGTLANRLCKSRALPSSVTYVEQESCGEEDRHVIGIPPVPPLPRLPCHSCPHSEDAHVPFPLAPFSPCPCMAEVSCAFNHAWHQGMNLTQKMVRNSSLGGCCPIYAQQEVAHLFPVSCTASLPNPPHFLLSCLLSGALPSNMFLSEIILIACSHYLNEQLESESINVIPALFLLVFEQRELCLCSVLSWAGFQQRVPQVSAGWGNIQRHRKTLGFRLCNFLVEIIKVGWERGVK